MRRPSNGSSCVPHDNRSLLYPQKGCGLETPVVVPRKEKLTGSVWKLQPTETRKDPAARLRTEPDPLFPVQVDPRDVCLSCSDAAELKEQPQLSSSLLHFPCTLPQVPSEEHPQFQKQFSLVPVENPNHLSFLKAGTGSFTQDDPFPLPGPGFSDQGQNPTQAQPPEAWLQTHMAQHQPWSLRIFTPT